MSHDLAAHQPAPEGTRLGEFWSILPEESSRVEGPAGGELAIGGVGVTELAERFGTPLHVMDEVGLRRQIRRFIDGLRERWPNSEVLYASKSLPTVGMYRVAQEEGLSVDVAGGGEIKLALAAGVDPKRLYFHGNAKTDAELQLAIDAGVGTIIVDNEDEIDRLERLLTSPQKVLLRVIPGVEAETHASQATGGAKSKFGLPMDQAKLAIKRMQASPHIAFEGVHLHIGSQILNTTQFAQAVENISSTGTFATYDVGGGLGVKYTYDEIAPSVESFLDAIAAAAKSHLPADAKIMIEPGRSVVARAGVTLYRVVAVKRTGEVFVAVDGGLADQMDIALTQQRYEAILANRLDEPWTESVQLVGRQCESGDLLVDDAPMPAPRVGDIVAMPVTGAYAYTMSNNYNGALKPAIVFVQGGEARLVTRRETYDDLLATHITEPHVSSTAS
ncbi:MAG: diaminopimelate decarboxylase [Leucobacter sp.]